MTKQQPEAFLAFAAVAGVVAILSLVALMTLGWLAFGFVSAVFGYLAGYLHAHGLAYEREAFRDRMDAAKGRYEGTR